MDFEPVYLTLLRSGELEERALQARQHLLSCDLCARHCRVNRMETTKGTVCQMGVHACVASYGAHHGEEKPLRGWQGSGTIFFNRCNLRCVYCQNWEISQKPMGREVGSEELAAMMLELQRQGCHNINFVTPSHVVAPIISAVSLAARAGLCIPLVYNTGGYDSLEALRLFDGIIDIYMPDMKYGDSATARRFSRVSNYVETNQQAVKEMYRQTGDLVLDSNGIALRGLLIRHLVLPQDLAGSSQVLSFIACELSRNTYLNLMDQYHPCYRANEYPPLDHPLNRAEYDRTVMLARSLGLNRLD